MNARDAINDVGTVTIETGMVEVEKRYRQEHLDAESGPYIMLALSDDGAGMDRETRENIFEPFYTTKGKQGTGLGLSTIYDLRHYEAEQRIH